MKKFYIILISAAFLTSCQKDLLDTKNASAVESSNMWTTENLTDLGVAGVYAALNNTTLTAAGNEIYVTDMFGFTGQTRNAQTLTVGTVTPGDGLFSNNWRGLYEGIQRANDGILNVPKSPVSAAKKGRYVAECLFLRAYFYMKLNQLWKGVPIYLVPFSDLEATKPRSTEAEVWTQIITDLTACINEPNLPMKYTKGSGDFGHATKSAAYALRGKAYLLTGQFPLAIADFSKVKDAGHTLFANYSALFKEANEQSDEMIFSVQNMRVAGYGNQTQWRLGTRSSLGSGFNTYFPSPNLIDLYENVDGSPFNWNSIIPGYNSMAAAKREVYFLRNNLTTAESNAAKARGLDMTLYLPNGNEQRIKTAYANRDPRLAATVITPYSTYLGVFGSDNSLVTLRWPFRTDNLTTQDLRADGTGFYYLYRKFVYEGNSELLTRDASPTDMPIIRYADVLLMWAEAINEQGFTQEAVNLVNQIRSRAGVAILQSTNPAAPTYVNSQVAMRDRIRDERRREMAIEGINYFDELRWGTLKSKVFFAGNGIKHVFGTNQITYTYAGDQILRWPIPQVERERNPSLVQNPGWPD